MKANFDESNRLIFYKKRDLFPSGLGNRLKIFLLLSLSNIFLLIVFSWAAYSYSSIRYQTGVADGIKQALDTRNPSEQLEIACAGLWVGEQNKRYWQKQK